jgi:hypothetical protein
MRVSITAVCLALSLPSIGLTQSNRGAITGLISDPTGASVVGAKVKALNVDTKVPYTTETNQVGNYTLRELPAGFYDVAIQASGFRTSQQKSVQINIGQTATLSVALQLGSIDQSVEVSAAVTQIQAATSDLGSVVSREKVMDLPLAVTGAIRNPEAFIFLTPGVTGSVGNTQIDGGQSRSKEVLLDGAASTGPESGGTWSAYPSVEAISEFKLVRGGYNAEYGRAGSGFEVFTTKSGTNQFHGALFEYLRNNVFDARGFFAHTTPVNRQNEFGGSLGGPVTIPKVYNGKNRTFFYFVYDGFRYTQAVTNSLVSLPPADFRQGDFSRLASLQGNPMAIYDPGTTAATGSGFTRDPFPGNRIPLTQFSAVSSKILPFLPSLNNNHLLGNFLTIGNNSTDQNQYNGKIDHLFTEQHRVSAFVSYTDSPQKQPETLPEPFANQRTLYNYYTSLRLNYDWVISPAMLNQFLAGFTRTNAGGQMYDLNQGWPDKIGLTGVNSGIGNTFPVMTFSDGYAPWGESSGGRSYGGQINNTTHIADNLSYVAGKHALKAGVDLRWLQTNGEEWLWNQGSFGFSSFETALPTVSGITNSGSSFASFLLGDVDSTFRRVQNIFPSNHYRYFGAYVQDDWKFTPKLTLNIGLRYDLNFPRTSKNNDQSSFDPTVPNPGAGGRLGAIAFLGDGPYRIGRNSFADTDYKSFGPRLGFAYQLDAQTVVRGGYGIFYAPGNATEGLRLSTGFSYGLSVQPTYTSTNQGITPALNWDGGFPTNFAQPPQFVPQVANGSSVNMIGRNDGRTPYVQNWSLGIQRELPAQVVLETVYTGNKGTRLGNGLISLNELNPSFLSLGSLLRQQVTSTAAVAAGIAVPYSGFTGSVAQALRPYPQYQGISDASDPNGNSTYEALQVSAQKRMSHGFTFTLAYSFSKVLSDGDVQAGGGPSGQTFYNRRLEKAISDVDVPQMFTVSYIYELPFGTGKRFLNQQRVVRTLAGGWSISGIHQYNSGLPITLTATNTLPLFNGVLRPDVVIGASKELAFHDPATDRYINPAAFAVPGAYRLGTAARAYTDLRTFPNLNESFGLAKRTSLGDKAVLIFRAEFFNAFNRVVFGTPQSNISNSNFGMVTSQANAPRQGQVALRLEF